MRRRFRSTSEFAAAMASDEFRGKAMHVLTLHDDACTPSMCVCEPEYIVEDLTVDSYVAGQQAQAAWIKATTS